MSLMGVDPRSDFGEIGFSEEQADLLTVATDFCRDKSPMEKVRALMTTDAGFDADVWREISELGWLGVTIPEAYGGVGLGLAEVAPIMEQMGRTMMATPFLSTTLAAQAVLAAGTEAQKAEILPAIASGEVATLALMEETGAWDPTRIAAKAAPTDDGFRLSGEKIFVCDAEAARWIVVSAMIGEEPSLFVLERSQLPEGALRRETLIDETKRSFALRLDSVPILNTARLDPAQSAAAFDRIELAAGLLSAAECCGGALAVIDYTIDYLKTRTQFGKTIGSYQALKHPIVDAFVQYEQARSHLYSAAHCCNDQGAGEIAVHMARASADTTLSYAADRSIQFHGGFGFTYDCDAQLFRRRAIWHAAVFGDAMHHKKRLSALIF